MKLSEIKGKKQVKVVGKLMCMVDGLSDCNEFKAFLEELKNGEDKGKALFKLGPLLERDDVADSLVSIVAFAKGIDGADADKVDVLFEVMELLNDDVELPAFLSEQQ